ncbi:MAG: hypothetical protein ACOC1S_02925 [bacterium]
MMKDNKLDIQKFITDFFESIGGVVDTVSYAYVEILLPEEYLSYFNKQELYLAFDPEVAEEKDAEFITIGSPLLDKIIDLIISRKKVLVRHINLKNVRLPSEPITLIDNTFNFYKCRTPEIKNTVIEEHHYLAFIFEINLTSDEKEKYLDKVFVDMHRGQLVDHMEESLENILYSQDRRDYYPVAPLIELDKAFYLALNEVEDISAKRKKNFENRLDKYRIQELKQVKQFYRKKRNELEEKLNNLKEKIVQNKEKKLNRVKQKLEANAVNKKRRLEDITEKYSCEVDIKLDSLIDYTLPRIRTYISLQQRQNFHQLELLFNPLMRKFEPLLCSNCEREITNIFINDNHPYCEQCFDK